MQVSSGYPKIGSPNFMSDLLAHKELYALKMDPNRNFRSPPGTGGPIDDLISGKHLKLHSHQLFVRNFFGPNSQNTRLHVSHGTGTGKTLLAVGVGHEYIQAYHKMFLSLAASLQANRRNYIELDSITPSVFVLGFGGTKSAFMRELMRYPEFGFITSAEKEELAKLRALAASNMPDDIKHAKDFYSNIKKRVTNKVKGGFYKFYGYEEFVNRLFSSESIKLTDVEAEYTQRSRAGEDVSLESLIGKYIRSGRITVNQQMLIALENSLIIADEIHNTYNMNSKNDRGIALMYVLDVVPTVRLLTLSATPINNSPSEVVELVNYLLVGKKVTKKDFFANSRDLLPGALEKLGKLLTGRVSFLQDTSEKYFPQREFLGDVLRLPEPAGSFPAGAELPYLRFTPCPMSEFHQATYDHLVAHPSAQIAEELADPEDADSAALADSAVPTDGYAIYDIAFPNPDSERYGLFRSSDVKNKLAGASQRWKDSKGITVKKISSSFSAVAGDFLLRENIAKYSTKFAVLLDTLMEIIRDPKGDRKKCGKIMVYHDRVRTSGIVFLQELLKANSFLDEYGEAADDTLCALCGRPMRDHVTGEPAEGIVLHGFVPVRFVVAHSDVDKLTMEQSLEKLSAPANVHGLNYMILLGSKIIKESFDIKAMQHLIFASIPANIPTFLQILGRCVRKYSHLGLPQEQHKVSVRILLSVSSAVGKVSPEMRRYADKLADYIIIQKIERELNRNAVDANINRDIIMPPSLRSLYFPEGSNSDEPIAMLGNLYFDPAIPLREYKLSELNLSTFTANKLYEEEVSLASYIIKRLFMTSPVWTYDGLWEATRAPPFGVETNPALILENNFVIALHNLTADPAPLLTAGGKRPSESELVEKLFDKNERFIYQNGNKHRIRQVAAYYILSPVVDSPRGLDQVTHIEPARDPERDMIRAAQPPNERVVVDAEAFLRPPAAKKDIRVSVASFLREGKENANYLVQKKRFLEDYAHVARGEEQRAVHRSQHAVLPPKDIYQFIVDYPARFQMAFLEEAIIASITNVDKDNVETTLQKMILGIFGQFGVVVSLREVAKYKDTAKQYKEGLPAVPPDAPVGYSSAKSVRLYDPLSAQWIEVNKLAMNRMVTYKENDIIVGFLEEAKDSMKFKLRRPLHKIKEHLGTAGRTRKSNIALMDSRLVETGIVCETKNKHDLLQIVASLGISSASFGGSPRVVGLCEIIRGHLVANEIRERQEDTRVKYLYGWWDEPVKVGSRI